MPRWIINLTVILKYSFGYKPRSNRPTQGHGFKIFFDDENVKSMTKNVISNGFFFLLGYNIGGKSAEVWTRGFTRSLQSLPQVKKLIYIVIICFSELDRISSRKGCNLEILVLDWQRGELSHKTINHAMNEIWFVFKNTIDNRNYTCIHECTK